MPTNYYLFDEVIGTEELHWIYYALLGSSSWNLSHTTKRASLGLIPYASFPALLVETNGQIKSEFFAGYFRSVILRVRLRAMNEFGLDLPKDIRRIQAVAKSPFSRTEIHADSTNKDDWTILGFLNPFWNSSDGGEFKIDDNELAFLPGRFIVFPSHIEHDGGFVTNLEISYWRLAVNILLGSK
jgi:hypothetical protein